MRSPIEPLLTPWPTRLVALVSIAWLAAGCGGGAEWPLTSTLERVPPLSHPTIRERAQAALDEQGYRVAVFGDQRALLHTGESEALLQRVGRLAQSDPGLLLMVDTGDIVDNGNHADQFEVLRGLLSHARALPYLVSIGNHEIDSGYSDRARRNTIDFLANEDNPLTAERLYFSHTLGPVLFVFLNSNPLVYGPYGSNETEAQITARRVEQLRWMNAQLAARGPLVRRTVVAFHHPMIQSSHLHRDRSREMWNRRYAALEDRSLTDLLFDGGVDVVLTGHTHTYERFVVRREASPGQALHVVNVSGRPTTASRSAADLRGEAEFFSEWGWQTKGYTIEQVDVMLPGAERNQFAVLAVGPDGRIDLELHYHDAPDTDTWSKSEPVTLLSRR